MDGMVGRLDAKLAELGIRDNTLLVFLGDNGTNKGITSRFRGPSIGEEGHHDSSWNARSFDHQLAERGQAKESAIGSGE